MTVKKMTTGAHKGEWQARIQPVDKITKKRINFTPQYTSTKHEALILEREMWDKYNSDFDFQKADQKFSEAFKEYVNKQISNGYWSKSTSKAWEYSTRVFDFYFKDVKIEKMNQQLVRTFARQFVREHNSSASENSVIAKRLTHMRKFFKPLVGKCVTENPVPERFLSKFFRKDELVSQRKYHILNESEYSELSQAIKESLHLYSPTKSVSKLAVWIGLETGMRPQEIQALKWSNLVTQDQNAYFIIDNAWSSSSNHLTGHLKSRKVGESRKTLPISNDLKETLLKFQSIQSDFLKSKEIKNTNDFILLNLNNFKKSMNGIPVDQHRMNEMLHVLGKKANLEINPNEKWSMYSLRHSAATKLGNTPNMSYPWAASRLGHTLAQFMKTYVHVDRDINKEMESKWLA